MSHRVAASRGGPWTHWNVDVLCGECHLVWAENHPQEAEAEGWRVPGRIVRGEYRGRDATFARVVADALQEATA